jgi:hypothetical protein
MVEKDAKATIASCELVFLKRASKYAWVNRYDPAAPTRWLASLTFPCGPSCNAKGQFHQATAQHTVMVIWFGLNYHFSVVLSAIILNGPVVVC